MNENEALSKLRDFVLSLQEEAPSDVADFLDDVLADVAGQLRAFEDRERRDLVRGET